MGDEIGFEPNSNLNIVHQDGDDRFSSVDGDHVENRDGSKTINELQSWEVNVEAEKDVSELQDDCGLVNGMDTKTDQEANPDVPISLLVENSEYGSERASEENMFGQKATLLEECKKMVTVSQELSATINKCSTSVATGLREIGDLQDHNLEQGLGEDTSSKRIEVAAIEFKEEAGDGHDGPYVLDEGSIMEISQYSSTQSRGYNLPPKQCHSEPGTIVEASHVLSLVNEDSKTGIRDTVVGVSEWPKSVRQYQSCGHDAAITGDSDPISFVHPQNVDAFPQLKEGFQEEKEGGDLQANHNEEPSADNLPIEQNLSAATQLDDDLETSFGEEGASKEVDVVEEKDDVARRDLPRATSKTCGEKSIPAVTEKLESSYSEPSASGKAGTILGTNEHLKLNKEIMSTAAATCLVWTKEHEAISFGTNELIDPPKEKEINLKRRLSTSPSSQYIKKHRRRKSSNDSSTTETLNVGNYPSEYIFSVGDLVWGKIRSHPWWPGQIFDHSDASENASNYFQRMQKDRLLVAFFGDATFGWCEESQLLPFQPYFAEKLKQTPAKAFRNAVTNALDELTRRVELGLTCFCGDKEARHVLESKAMLNAGIREGTVVNDHKDTVDAINAFDPLKLLSTIQHFAKFPHMLCDLEISVACAQASAFLTFKGLLVSGKISLEASGIGTISLVTQDSAELGLSPRGRASSYGKHKRKPEEKPPRRTKKRKINDLIAECGPSHEAEEDGNSDNETLLEMQGRIKKRKVNELLALYVLPNEERDLNGHDETLHDIAVTGSGDANAESTMIRKEARRGTAESKERPLRRRVSTLKTKKDQESESVAIDILNNDIKALQSKIESNSTASEVYPDAKKTPKTSKFGQCIRKVASELAATPANSKTVRNANFQKKWEHVDKSATKGSPSTTKQSPGPIKESCSTRELLSELLTVARNPLYWAKKKKMPSRLINSFLQFRNAVFEKSSTNSDITKASILNFANEPDESTCPQISTKIPGSPSISKSQAIDSADREFCLRPASHVRKAELKRKAEFSSEGAQKKKRTLKSPSAPWPSKKLKNELEDKTGDRYVKQYSRRTMVPQSPATSLTKFSTDSYGIQRPAVLFMKFPKGFALPSEIQLKAKFARYGSREISETRVFRSSGCAQVVFKTSASAEAAFNFASENNVFGSANVSFRLQYPSSESRAGRFQKKNLVKLKHERNIQQDHRQSPSLRNELREGSGHQETLLQPSDALVRFTEKMGVSRPNTSGEPQLLLIQQNLEMMTSMLSQSEYTSTSATATSDNIPPDSKRDIMDEMMSLLQKVSALVCSPP